jgi:hypothetical protein
MTLLLSGCEILESQLHATPKLWNYQSHISQFLTINISTNFSALWFIYFDLFNIIIITTGYIVSVHRW